MKTVLALLVMLSVPLLLPVLPVPGLPGLIAGLLGGYLAGAAGRAGLLALLPALVIASAIALVGFGVGVPWLGSAIAAIALIWLVVENVALLLGAVIGGAIAASRRDRQLRGGPALSSPRISDATPRSARPTVPAVRHSEPISRSEAL